MALHSFIQYTANRNPGLIRCLLIYMYIQYDTKHLKCTQKLAGSRRSLWHETREKNQRNKQAVHCIDEMMDLQSTAYMLRNTWQNV